MAKKQGLPPEGLQPEEEELQLGVVKAPINEVGQTSKHEDGKLASLIADATSNQDIVNIISRTPQDQLIPWEEATLPSKGVYYGWESGVVEVRPWGANVDKIMATQRLAQTGQSVDYMIKECCRFPDGFDPSDLLVGDQIFLLYYLRAATHGNIYEFMSTCPSQQCGAQTSHTVDLNDLATTITWADVGLGSEPFKLTMPYCTRTFGRDIWISVRFLRVKDTHYIQRTKKARELAMGGSNRVKIQPREHRGRGLPPQRQSADQVITIDDTLTKNIETLIVDVMGVADRFKIKDFVEKMHSSDIAVIRDWLADNSPGIETNVKLACKTCGEEYLAMLPITASFFRPQEQ